MRCSTSLLRNRPTAQVRAEVYGKATYRVVRQHLFADLIRHNGSTFPQLACLIRRTPDSVTKVDQLRTVTSGHIFKRREFNRRCS
jgi:hypothetical protein